MEVYDHLDKLGALLIAFVSGLVFQYSHTLQHAVFGTSFIGIVFVSSGIGLLSIVGYLLWVGLTDIPLSTGILTITGLAGWILHFLSHVVEGLTAVAVVGEYMFWVGLVGALLNYFLVPEGVWLYGDEP